MVSCRKFCRTLFFETRTISEKFYEIVQLLGKNRHLNFDEDDGVRVGEGNVAEGLETSPDLLGLCDGADADSSEAALDSTISCFSDIKTEQDEHRAHANYQPESMQRERG